jgi:hypothetical protein
MKSSRVVTTAAVRPLRRSVSGSRPALAASVYNNSLKGTRCDLVAGVRSNLSQSIEEGNKITVARKYLLAVVSPRHQMVEQPTCMYAGMAWHVRQIAS